MLFVYIIGAQCTGKTTLANSMSGWIEHHWPESKFALLSETARHTLRKHDFDRDDIRRGGERCLQLQKLIMQEQDARESNIEQQSIDIVVSDRSGLDALVFAEVYSAGLAGCLQKEAYWIQMRSRMHAGIVIVCEPVTQWLVDDGTRLMPQDESEWLVIHDRFVKLLTEHGIAHTVLPSSIEKASDRTEFAIQQISRRLNLLAEGGGR